MRLQSSMVLGGEASTGHGRAPVTIALIIANVIAYAVTTASMGFLHIDPSWLDAAGFIPALVLSDPARQWYRFFTSMFLHADIFHIFFNMYFLYVFGRAVEGSIGSARFLALYMLGGLAASTFHTLFSILQGTAALAIPAIGASGAISAVLGAYMVLYPGTRLSACIFIPFPVCFTTRAAYFLLFWFATQVIYGYARLGATVAFFAHAGGFVAGVALLPLLADLERIERIRASMYYGPLFGFIIPLYHRPYPYREGLGVGARTIYTLLSMALLVGGLWAYAWAVGLGVTMHLAYLKASLSYAAIPAPASSVEGYVVLASSKEGVVPESFQQMPSDLRVFFNRLYYSNLLYNPQAKGREVFIKDAELTAAVPVCGRVISVPVYVEKFHGVYDLRGILERGEGRIGSYVIRVNPITCYTVLDTKSMVVYEFKIVMERSVPLPSCLLGYAAAVTVLTLLSIYTIHARRELTIVP